ncbi:MAG: hypothetical protein ACRDQ0_16895, partial [Pseudonocardia sp.]
ALPHPVQQITRLPLYLKLLLAAGPTATTTDANPYALIDHCVRSVVRATGRNVDHTFDALGDVNIHVRGQGRSTVDVVVM